MLRAIALALRGPPLQGLWTRHSLSTTVGVARHLDSRFGKLFANSLQFLLPLRRRRWIAQLEGGQRIDKDLGNDQPGIKLVICGDDVPRCMLGTGCAQALLIGVHIIVPKFPLFDIGLAQFPILIRFIDSAKKTLPLFFFRNMKKELHDSGSVVVEMAFQVEDRAKPLPPNCVVIKQSRGKAFTTQDLGMNSDDKYFLVVRPIENANPPTFRKSLRRSP